MVLGHAVTSGFAQAESHEAMAQALPPQGRATCTASQVVGSCRAANSSDAMVFLTWPNYPAGMRRLRARTVGVRTTTSAPTSSRACPPLNSLLETLRVARLRRTAA
jgi:hypothetical protein